MQDVLAFDAIISIFNSSVFNASFNELCLPIYDSLEDMQHSLLIAINEGSEGFGMS